MRIVAGEPPAAAGGSRLAAIDGLRGFAIALIVIYHIWPGFTKPLALTIVPLTGWVGVDLFFFISGFAIFYPYARTAVDGHREQTLRTFVLRRFGKIVPSYVLAIIVVLALGIATTMPGTTLTTQLVTHALFIHNWYPATEEGLIGVLWSLGVEVQFYVLFAFTRKLALRSPLVYAASLVAIALGFHLWVALALHRHDGIVMDQLPANLDLFGAGIACAYLYRKIDAHKADLKAKHGVWTFAAFVATVVCYALLFVIRRSALDPTFSSVADSFVHIAEAVTLFTLTLATLFALPQWQRFVANPVTLYLADISYNLYIWHQLIYVNAEHRFGGAHLTRSRTIALGLASLAFSLVLTTLLTKYYEHPLQVRFRRLEPN